MNRYLFLLLFTVSVQAVSTVSLYAQPRPVDVRSSPKIVFGKFPSSKIVAREYTPARANYRPKGSNEEVYELENEDNLVVVDTRERLRRKLSVEKVGDLEMGQVQKPELTAKLKPKSQWDVAFGGVDPMIAVGHDFITVSDGGSLAFYNKTGQKLAARAGGSLPSSARQLFAFFLERNLSDGSPNPSHPNNWFPDVPTNVPDACNSNNPGDTDDGIIDEAYDTRILYQKTYKRFVILSAIRNQSWSCSDCAPADKAICKASSVRLYAWAVSITQDPRDGFYLYITGNNNVRDWPRVVVDDDYMVVAHNGKGRLNTPAISIFSWPDMAAGSSNVRRVDVMANGVGPRMYIPVQNKGMASNNLLFVHKEGNSHLDFYQVKKPGVRSSIFSSMVIPMFIGGISYEKNVFKGPLPGITYDNKGVHFTTVQTEVAGSLSAAPRYSTHIWNIPFLTGSGGKLVMAPFTAGSGFVNYRVNSSYSYEYPAIAVNSLNDVFVAFVRSAIKADGTKPEVRYTAWVHGKEEPINSVLVRASESQPTFKCAMCTEAIPDNLTNDDDDKIHIDYAWAAADPSETGVFWLSHAYFNASQELRLHVAKVNLVPLY